MFVLWESKVDPSGVQQHHRPKTGFFPHLVEEQGSCSDSRAKNNFYCHLELN